jgi:hypothetical protein
MADLLEKIERDIAKLNVLLGEVDTTHEKERTLPVDKGIKLLQVLDTELRPFIVKYTALLNRSNQFIPIEPSKLERFVPITEELMDCVELDFSTYGLFYWIGLGIINGNNFNDDIEEAVYQLYRVIKMTGNTNGTISLHTYSKRDSGIDLFAPVITKDEEEE